MGIKQPAPYHSKNALKSSG